MILSVTAHKGGVGKSTLTFSLASLLVQDGYKVCIADSDQNNSCVRWSQSRDELIEQGMAIPAVPVFTTPDRNLRADIKNLRQQYDIVLIDGSPRHGEINTKILYVSDYVLIPTLTSNLDIATLESLQELLTLISDERATEISHGVVINRFDKKREVHRGYLEMIKDHPLGVFENTLGNRTIYEKASITGLGIHEIMNERNQVLNPQAVSELMGFYTALLHTFANLPYERGRIFSKHK